MNFNDIADLDSIRLDTPIQSERMPRWQRKMLSAQSATSSSTAASACSSARATPAKARATPAKTPKVRSRRFQIFEIFEKKKREILKSR